MIISRKPRFPSLLALAMVVALVACAPQAQLGGPGDSTWAADEAAIRAATTASADAWNRGDLKAHLAIYVDSVTFMFILSGGSEPEQSGWFTLVWVRTPAGWKAVHDHSS